MNHHIHTYKQSQTPEFNLHQMIQEILVHK